MKLQAIRIREANLAWSEVEKRDVEIERLTTERDALSEELRVEKLNHGYLREEFDGLHTNAVERLRQLQASIKERDALRIRCTEHDQLRYQHRECDSMGVELQRLRAEVDALRLDAKRMDWLERQHVEVRYPLRYGSRKGFHSCPDINDAVKQEPSDLRAAIDAAMKGKP